MRQQEEFMTKSAAARLLGVSAQSVRAYEMSGKLPAAVKTDAGVRIFKRSDVERFARERKKRKAVR